MLQPEVAQPFCGLLEGHLLPAKDLAAARMGQQGAAQHKPMGLPQQLPLPTQQLPDTILAIEVAHQGAVVGLPCFASFAGQA